MVRWAFFQRIIVKSVANMPNISAPLRASTRGLPAEGIEPALPKGTRF
jgi:hypothetical protein